MKQRRSSLPYILLAVFAIFSAGLFLGRVEKDYALRKMFHAHRGRSTASEFKTEGDFKALAGFWLGNLEAADLRILYRITSKGEVYTYSLDQGGALIPASTTMYDSDNGQVVFVFPEINGVYEAFLDESGNKLKGKWNQGRNLPLDMDRYHPSEDGDMVPREYRFTLQKSVSGTADKLVQMAGFWSGYLDDDDDDDDQPQLVILQVEQITDDLVEPKLLEPEDSDLPYPIRSLQVGDDGKVKVVVDVIYEDINAVFEGQLSADGKKLSGNVFYDDEDNTPPLELVWSEHRPVLEKVQ